RPPIPATPGGPTGRLGSAAQAGHASVAAPSVPHRQTVTVRQDHEPTDINRPRPRVRWRATMMFPAEFHIGERVVGPQHPPYVIAEAGSNHNRDLSIAYRLIDVAADARADAVKFQTYSGDRLYSRKAPQFKYLPSLASQSPSEF